MDLRLWIGRMAALGSGAVALAGAVPSEAAVIAHSALEIRNLSPDAFFMYPGPFRFDASAEMTTNEGLGSGNYDVGGLWCWDNCPGAGAQVGSAAPGAAQESILGGAQSLGQEFGPFRWPELTTGTVAEFTLLNPSAGGGAYAFGDAQMGARWRTLDYVIIGFDAVGSLQSSSDIAGGSALASFTWVARLLDGGSVVAEFAPDALNRSLSVSGIGAEDYAVNEHFAFTVTGLSQGRTYTLETVQRSFVSGRLVDLPPPGVPEPATWTLMLAGFGALGAALRRRRALRVG